MHCTSYNRLSDNKSVNTSIFNAITIVFYRKIIEVKIEFIYAKICTWCP